LWHVAAREGERASKHGQACGVWEVQQVPFVQKHAHESMVVWDYTADKLLHESLPFSVILRKHINVFCAVSPE
jgi:hypothetical protein